MTSEALHVPSDQHLDYQIVAQHIVEGLKEDQKKFVQINGKLKMHKELSMSAFWRAVFSECVASFFYVFIVCGAAAGAGVGASTSSLLLATSLASGLAIAVLTHCFLHISGAHINPAVTIACFFTRNITPLRTTMYVMAQLSGSIGGAGLLYWVSLPGYQVNLQAALSHSENTPVFQRLGVEMVLTSVVVFTYFVSTNTHRKIFGNSAMLIGAAYSACNFVSMPYLNPARSMGPSFVLGKWDNHWIFWIGPILSGAISGILFEMVYGVRKRKKNLNKDVEEASSMTSGDDINYDLEVPKPNQMQPKFHGENYNTYRSAQGNQRQLQQNMCQTVYQPKVEREPIYGGTRSMYCKSPQLTRANLHRSQSVYTKSNTTLNRENSMQIRNGPLVPAQSLYPLRVAPTAQQNTHLQNQNVQNQLQQRTESLYGIRSSFRQQHQHQQQQQQQQSQQQPERIVMERTVAEREPSAFQPIYGLRSNPPTPNDTLNFGECREEPVKYGRRPDSVYGSANRRIQSAQSDDSSYGSYHGSGSQGMTPPGGNYNTQNNGSIIGHQQVYGMLPLPHPPSVHHHPMHKPQQQSSEQMPLHKPPSMLKDHSKQQSERKLSSSTTSSQVQRSVDFKDFSSKSSLSSNHPPQSPLPPPPPPAPQIHNYQMHSIRQH